MHETPGEEGGLRSEPTRFVLRTPGDAPSHVSGRALPLSLGVSGSASAAVGEVEVELRVEGWVWQRRLVRLAPGPAAERWAEMSLTLPAVRQPTPVLVRARAAGVEMREWRLWALPAAP